MLKINDYQTKTLLQNQYIKQLLIVDSCSSCLDLAAHWPSSQTLILAEQQTAGRGQNNKSWLSPKHTGIWASYIIEQNHPALAIKAALALAISLEELGCPPSIKIKWPNDIYLNKQKTAGILIEGTNIGGQQTWAIGIGITYLDVELPGIQPLAKHWPECCTREQLISTWVTNFHNILPENNIAEIFQEYDLLQGENIAGGQAAGIDNQGQLLVQTPKGIITLNRNH